MAIFKKLRLPLALLMLLGFIGWYIYYDLQYITMNGKITVQHVRNFQLSFPVIVRNVQVTEGMVVHKGDPLITLNFDEITLHKKQIAFEIEKALNEIQIEKNQITRLESDFQYAIKMQQRYKEQLERETILMKNGAVTQDAIQFFQDTLNYYNKNQSDVSTAINSKTSDHSSIKLLEQRIKVLRDEATKIDEQLRLNAISDNALCSPVANGVVCAINVSPGSITKADQPVISLIDLDSVIVVGEASEKTIRFIEPGAPAKIILKTDYWKRQWGTVRTRSEMAFKDQNGTFFKIEIDLKTKNDYMLPNCNVIVKVRRKVNWASIFSL